LTYFSEQLLFLNPSLVWPSHNLTSSKYWGLKL